METLSEDNGNIQNAYKISQNDFIWLTFLSVFYTFLSLCLDIITDVAFF